MHPNLRWRASRSRARSPRMHHASYPVFVHRPAASDWASFRPRLATMPLPFSLPSALRKPGHRTCTYEVTRHARRTRLAKGRAEGASQRPKGANLSVGLDRSSMSSAPFAKTKFIELLNREHHLEIYFRNACWGIGLPTVLLASHALGDPFARSRISKKPFLCTNFCSHVVRSNVPS